MLFTMHINDIRNILEIIDLASYMNDTAFYTSHDDTHILLNCTNIELKKLYIWQCLNKISLNTDNSNHTLFSS